MDRFVAHCVATALITAAFAAASTVRAESSGAATAPLPTAPSAATAVRFPIGRPTLAAALAAAELLPAAAAPGISSPAVSQPAVSVPMIPAVAGPMPIGSPPVSDNPAPNAGGPDAMVESGVSKGAVCADVYQVGSTVYAHWHREIIFSIKQYYSPSCHARYSYAFPWLRFRESSVSYDIGLAVLDLKHDELDGAVTYVNGVGSPNYWSAPVSVPPDSCTEATVHLFLPDDETDTFTQKACL